MKAQVFNPAVQVLLLKNVPRIDLSGDVKVSNRFRSADRIIDLTPWLADNGGVRTSKSVREPAGGFSITLTDKMHPKDLDSIHGLIEPMDVVEIRMAREPHKHAGKNLPIVMRGFVSSSRRSESMSSSGKPQRTVVISGQDYGKLWQIYQIFYEMNFPVAATLITQWKLFTKYGEFFQNKPAREFIQQCIENILNPFIVDMMVTGGVFEHGTPLKTIQIGEMTAENGTVAAHSINQFQGGSLYSMMRTYGDVGPWNELFMEDREDGVYVVYRHNPYFSIDGKFLPSAKFDISDAQAPKLNTVYAHEVESIAVDRSDANVANYFWVDSSLSQLVNGSMVRLMAVKGDPETFLVQTRNCDPAIYGLRKMFEMTHQLSPDNQYHGNGITEAAKQSEAKLTVDWLTKRRVELVEQNRDNVVFETGTIRINGREDIKAGSYVEVIRGSSRAEFYVVAVDHEFIPFVGFFTTLSVDRGTGFVERVQQESGKQSPYLSEMQTTNA